MSDLSGPSWGAGVVSGPVSVIASGEAVSIRRPVVADQTEFLNQVSASQQLHGPWVSPPSTPEKFQDYVRRMQTGNFEPYLICHLDDGSLAGVINISEIVRGSFESGYLGYYAFAPWAGGGFMSEGLALVLAHAFGPLALHRLEANIQPGNRDSTLFVQRAGFRREGYSPRYLKIGGEWCDHERWAITVEDWQAASDWQATRATQAERLRDLVARAESEEEAGAEELNPVVTAAEWAPATSASPLAEPLVTSASVAAESVPHRRGLEATPPVVESQPGVKAEHQAVPEEADEAASDPARPRPLGSHE